MWARHEYTTISTTAISNELAALALSADVRPQILGRTRGYIRRGYAVLEEWVQKNGDVLHLFPPDAAAISFARYDADINSTKLVEQLRNEQSILTVPGDHFGIDRCLRISFGLPKEYLLGGLDRIQQGEPIAKVGATGRVSGPHLDWRMNLLGNRLDPQLLVGPMEPQ